MPDTTLVPFGLPTHDQTTQGNTLGADSLLKTVQVLGTVDSNGAIGDAIVHQVVGAVGARVPTWNLYTDIPLFMRPILTMAATAGCATFSS